MLLFCDMYKDVEEKKKFFNLPQVVHEVRFSLATQLVQQTPWSEDVPGSPTKYLSVFKMLSDRSNMLTELKQVPKWNRAVGESYGQQVALRALFILIVLLEEMIKMRRNGFYLRHDNLVPEEDHHKYSIIL